MCKSNEMPLRYPSFGVVGKLANRRLLRDLKGEAGS